ncbi:MAG: O-antigen ligase family protein [Acidobacteriota bacterium]|nr:O-antigen ligase family protein [Acidobacteriota bacterium]
MRPFPIWVIVALIISWGPFQIVISETVAPWLTVESSLTWFTAGASFLLASEVSRSARGREVFLDILLWSITALAGLALLQISTDPEHVFWIFPAQQGTVGTFHYKNQFAAMVELAAPVALYRALSPRTRFAGSAAFLILFAAAVASVSRAGVLLVTSELAISAVIAIRRSGVSWKKAGVVVSLTILLLCAAAAAGGSEGIQQHFQEQAPYAVRQRLLESSLRIVADTPWLGSGLGTWVLVYPRYATFDPGVLVNAAHCDWVEWAAEGGFLFAAWIAILIASVSRQALRSVWGMGVLAIAIHSLVDYPARKPILTLIWFALAGALSREPAGRVVRHPGVHAGATSVVCADPTR